MPTPKPKDDFVPESVTSPATSSAESSTESSGVSLTETAIATPEDITQVLVPAESWLENPLTQTVAAKMLSTYAIKGYPMPTACQIVSGYLKPLMVHLAEYDLKTPLEVEIATAFAIQYSDRGIDPKIAAQSIIDALKTAQEHLK